MFHFNALNVNRRKILFSFSPAHRPQVSLFPLTTQKFICRDNNVCVFYNFIICLTGLFVTVLMRKFHLTEIFASSGQRGSTSLDCRWLSCPRWLTTTLNTLLHSPLSSKQFTDVHLKTAKIIALDDAPYIQ